jgi:hypothetical protein
MSRPAGHEVSYAEPLKTRAPQKASGWGGLWSTPEPSLYWPTGNMASPAESARPLITHADDTGNGSHTGRPSPRPTRTPRTRSSGAQFD